MKNSNKRYQLFFHVIVMLLAMQQANAQTSSLVSVGADGKLLYTADSKGNVVPEFSGVGYMNSEADIPAVGVVKTLYPVAGDNLTNVQNAINEVALMPLDANGFRGAILFKSGTYNVSDTIQIKVSGIVLRGEGYDGSGTNFIATKTSQHSLFNFAGTTGTSNVSATKKAITDAYVPIGAKQVTVASGHTFVTGDRVFVHRIPNAAWISLLGMNLLSQIDPLATDWTASAYDMNYERKVTGVNGNVISLDAPIMDIIDPLYSTGELLKYTSARIEKCGIENMRISSVYASATDENHGWEAVTFSNLTDGWAKNLEVYYFGYSAVHILSSAAWITVDGCKMFDAKSLIDGGKRYSFNVDGQRCLVKNCVTRDGRHDYVNGSRTCGPTVFYNCTATVQNNDIGPHHRWSTGILFDNIIGDGRMDVQNRSVSGGGHGWAGAQVMFWNCDALRMVIQDPPGDARNWAIGCNAPATNIGDMVTEPLGIVESQGTHIAAIPSLFMAQLNERLTAIRQNQTINFSALPAKVYGDGDFSPAAVASSGLTVSYTSSDTSVATIVNGNIHIIAPGTSIITASQPGNTYYNAAANVTQALTVAKANQTITFNTLPAKLVVDADFNPGATASSGLSVSYTSSDTAVATIVSGSIHIVGAGTSVITASQSGNATYNAATDVAQTLTVTKQNQTITFNALPAMLVGAADFNPGATASSGLSVSYTSSNTAVATIVSGNIHIVGAGTSVITASQSGNATYNSATDVAQTLTVTKQNQTITFAALPSKVVGAADFNPGATASSGLSVSYTSSNTAVATIVSGNIHIVAAGSSVITASQPGNAAFNAAANITQTLTVTSPVVYNYSPTAVTILSGSLNSGAVGNLATNNSSYYVVNSTTSGTRKSDWYASTTISQVPSSVTKLTINYDGKNSAGKTQVLYLYNWTTSSWTQIDSRTVSTTDILITNTQTSPANFISSTGQVRVRVYSSGGVSNFRSSGDWLQISVETLAARPTISSATKPGNDNIDVSAYPNPVVTNGNIKYSLPQDATVNLLLFNMNGQIIKTIIPQKFQQAGSYIKSYDATGLSSGTYFLFFKAGSFEKVIKLSVTK